MALNGALICLKMHRAGGPGGLEQDHLHASPGSAFHTSVADAVRWGGLAHRFGAGPLEPAEKQSKKGRSLRKSEAQELQDALSPPPKSDGGAPAFDIARIDPNGTSVFAGRAEPNSAVTITADGKEIGTVQANENGEWTFTTDAKIPNPDAKLALFKAASGAGAHVAEAAPAEAAN